MKSIEELLLEISTSKLFINNLFQLPPTYNFWQANLTDGSFNSEFGKGATPQDALYQALSKWNYGRRIEVSKQFASLDGSLSLKMGSRTKSGYSKVTLDQL